MGNGEGSAVERLLREVELLDEAVQHGFAVPREWIQRLGIGRGFFATLRSDLNAYSVAVRRVHASLEYLGSLRSGWKYALYESGVKSRVKTPLSILEKMWRKRDRATDTPRPYRTFTDLAGARVTVSYLDYVYEVMDYISDSEEFRMIEFEDKIGNPLPTGYRGVHVIVGVPVEDCCFVPKVEIQIRTGYQNSWSTKAHELTYKKDSVPDDFVDILSNLGNLLYEADVQSLDLRKRLEGLPGAGSREDSADA